MDARRIYELMVLTAWADGTVEAAEALAVHELIASRPEFAQLTGKAEISRTVKARIDEKGLDDALRETVAGLDEREDRELAFSFCAQVLHADGEVGAEEAGVLADLQELFGLTTDDVRRLLSPAS